jgi:hypothetical protein
MLFCFQIQPNNIKYSYVKLRFQMLWIQKLDMPTSLAQITPKFWPPQFKRQETHRSFLRTKISAYPLALVELRKDMRRFLSVPKIIAAICVFLAILPSLNY